MKARRTLRIVTCLLSISTLLNAAAFAVPWKLDFKPGETIPLAQATFKSETGRPVMGTFWSVQRVNYPPLPCYPIFLTEVGFDVPVYVLDAERAVYVYDDRLVDYTAIYKDREAKRQEELALRSLELSLGLISAEEFSLLEGGGGRGPMSAYSSSDLWIEIIKVENDFSYLTLHGTVEGWPYQLLTKTNLAQTVRWLPDQIITGAFGTNQTDFSPKSVAGISSEFYRAHTSDVQIYVSGNSDGYEGNPLVSSNQAGFFSVFIGSQRTNDLTFYYQMSGVASNGVDYTNLLGAAVMAANESVAHISFHPVNDNLLEGKESITMTLLETNTYLINPLAPNATREIWDSAVEVLVSPSVVNAVEINGPPGAAAQAGVFTIYRNDYGGIYLPMQVRYSLSGTATNTMDYTNLNGVVTFAQNDLSKEVYIQPINDPILEGAESVTLSLVASNTYVINANNASTSLTMSDTTTMISVVATVSDAVEMDGPPGVGVVTGIFKVARDDTRGINLPMTVGYTLSGTASNGVDYTTLSGSLTFAAGETETNIFIQPISDVLVEGAETVTVTLTTIETYLIEPTAASAEVTIVDTTTTVEVRKLDHAIEPHPESNTAKQTGRFLISRADTNSEFPALTVSYQLIGTATNGIDYTNITGTVTIPATEPSVVIFIEPLFDGQIEGGETVILTLTKIGDGYLINPDFAAATNMILDNLATNTFQTIVVPIGSPTGIDYHQPSNSLIVAAGSSFVRIFTNTVGTNIVTVVTNWSGVAGMPFEVKLFTVKTTANGYTNGDVYFGSGNAIGWISADGTRSNRNWCVLTNAMETNALPVQGSLVMDTTGVFSNQLIAVTSPADRPLEKKGIWRIDSLGQPTLLTNFVTAHLEGVICLPNDVAKWGPWAGKIITGDENENKIYAIDGNGTVSTFDPTTLIPGGIRTEDFEIIPPNQDLYACDALANRVAKLSHTSLTNYVGDLMIVDAGEFSGSAGRLFILHWDAPTTNFITRGIWFLYSNGAGGNFEHVTFAPINIPSFTP